jgi:hypothetical protein
MGSSTASSRRPPFSPLIDVADYAHAGRPRRDPDGHEVDYGIDLAGGRTDCSRGKRPAAEPAELFRDTLARRSRPRAIEADEIVSVRFAPAALEIAVSRPARRAQHRERVRVGSQGALAERRRVRLGLRFGNAGVLDTAPYSSRCTADTALTWPRRIARLDDL